MKLVHYDDPVPRFVPNSIFLAGPTERARRLTVWRREAIEIIRDMHASEDVSVILPEFADGDFEYHRDVRFNERPEEAPPQMETYKAAVLEWETVGLRTASAVLFWMPFSRELPGFTTRCEVAQRISVAPTRVAIGMPSDAEHSTWIRYHAYRHQIPIATTLSATIDRALRLLRAE